MKKFLFPVAAVLLISSASALVLGTVPGARDLGVVERGETRQVTFYINYRGENQPVKLDPTVENPITSNLFGAGSPVDPARISQQDISSWITFDEQSLVVDPSTTETHTVNGNTVVAEGRLQLTLRVPNDPEKAEPGYHVVQISPSPSAVNSASGFGTGVQAVAKPMLIFRIPGQAEREIDMSPQDLRVRRTGENQVQILTTFRNTGTVTTQLNGGYVAVVNDNNEKVGEIHIPSVQIPPGEERTFSDTWRFSGINAGGEYGIEGTVGYITGKTYVTGDFAVTDLIRERIQVEDPQNQGPQDSGGEKGNTPIWLVLMFIVLVGALLYSFDVDPFWIVVALGFLTATSFVVLTGLPLYYIAVLLIIGGLVVYYV